MKRKKPGTWLQQPVTRTDLFWFLIFYYVGGVIVTVLDRVFG